MDLLCGQLKLKLSGHRENPGPSRDFIPGTNETPRSLDGNGQPEKVDFVAVENPMQNCLY